MKRPLKATLVLGLGTLAVFAVPFPVAHATDNLGCGDIPEWVYGASTYHGGTSGFPGGSTSQVVYVNESNRHSENVGGAMIDHGFFSRLHDTCN